MTDHARIAHDMINGINEVMIEAAHGNYDNDEMNGIALGALAKATIATTHALLAINDALQQRDAPRGACTATRFDRISDTTSVSRPCMYDDGHTGLHRHHNGITWTDSHTGDHQ